MVGLRELARPSAGRPRSELRASRAAICGAGRERLGLASLNTSSPIGGVAVGVMALIVVLGVMNGLRDDLRDRILVANPHLRILTYGAGAPHGRLARARSIRIRQHPGVVAASARGDQPGR